MKVKTVKLNETILRMIIHAFNHTPKQFLSWIKKAVKQEISRPCSDLEFLPFANSLDGFCINDTDVDFKRNGKTQYIEYPEDETVATINGRAYNTDGLMDALVVHDGMLKAIAPYFMELFPGKEFTTKVKADPEWTIK